jgi:N-acetylglucosaminyldiphosphoundecaprenol N-acetyl-beta-D-mannosaminyltransferase
MTQAARILAMNVNITSYADACSVIRDWAEQGASKYVCVANVASVMDSYDSPQYRRVMNEADLVTPDGIPLVWALRLLGCSDATRVYGPDLTPVMLETASSIGLPVAFYGGAPEVLNRLLEVVASRFPRLQVVYSWSPPFRPLTPEEDLRVVSDINESGARIVFVGLGSPKQDYWMAAHRGRIQAVMVGVGAAFDFLAGSKPQAPRWMMPLGLEWLFRLATEPRRLWKRYLKHNPRYVVLLMAQWVNWKFRRIPSSN